MGDPALNIDPYDDSESEEPITRPRFGVIQGGGESTPARAKLRAVSDESDKEIASDITPPAKLDEAEYRAEAPTGGATESETTRLGNLQNGLYSPDSSDTTKPNSNRIIQLLKRRKGLVGAGAAGGIVTIFGVFSILQGPFQIIHIAQLLTQFHFASLEDMGDSRVFNLYKYARNRTSGTVENTRLGIAGRRIAEHVDPEFARIGIEKRFDRGNLGTYQGTVIDPQKFAENARDGTEFHNLTPEEFAAKFKERFNVDLTVQSDGSLLSSSDNGFFAYFRNRRLNVAMAEEAGFGKVSGSVTARIMGKRDGVTWHPIRAADSRLVGGVDSFLTNWFRKQRQLFQNGEDVSITAVADAAPNDASGNPDPARAAQNSSAAGDVDDTIRAIRELDAELPAAGAGAGGEAARGIISQFAHSAGGRITITGTAAVGLVCGARALAESADAMKHDMVVLPLIRKSVQVISLGGQVMSNQDLDMRELGLFAKEFNDPKSGSWAAAKSIQAELNQPQTGPDIPDEANISKLKNGSAFTNVINAIPGVGVVCNAAESAVGHAVQWGVAALTPIGTAVSMAALSTDAAQNAIASVVRWMAGSPIPTMVFGPTYGNYVNYGARLAANDAKTALGGVSLNPSQSSALKHERLIAQQDEFRHKSLSERLLNPYEPNSMIAKAMEKSSNNVSTNVASLFSATANPLSSLSSVVKIFTAKAGAQENNDYDYGFPEVGYSLEELNATDYQDPFSNGEHVIAFLQSLSEEQFTSVSNKITQCFGATINREGAVDSGLSNTIDTLSDEYEGLNCGDSATEWTRIRFYILDTKVAEGLDCYYSRDASSCQQTGFEGDNSDGSSSPAPPIGNFRGQDTSTQACSVGTDAGVGDTPDTNKKIRLCNVEGIVVNVAIAPNVDAAVKGARAAGITLGATSSYRSYQTQLGLRRDHCGSSNYDIYQKPPGSCTPPTAKPGRSLHEWGLAVDFTCNGGSVSRSGPCFTWLSNNQGVHHLINLPSEPWHWSSTGS